MTDLRVLGLDKLYNNRGGCGSSDRCVVDNDYLPITQHSTNMSHAMLQGMPCRSCARGSPYERLTTLMLREMQSDIRHLRYMTIGFGLVVLLMLFDRD